MYLKYGSFQHDTNEAEVTIRRDRTHENGQLTAVRETWSIRGLLQAATQAELTTKLGQLNAAYADDGKDIGLFLDDGTPTHHVIISNGTTSGVQVISGPNFPEGRGAEYATGFGRTYELEISAEITPTENQSAILSYVETLSFDGGGPITLFLPVINGPWPKQLAAQQSTFRVTQDGQAIGRAGWPAAEPPIWPGDEIRPRRRITRKSPEKVATGQYSSFETSWHYEFEAVNDFAGNPHLPP